MAYSYATLKAAIQSMTGDSGVRLAEALDAIIIPQAEVRALRDLDLELFDVTGDVTFTINNAEVTKPAGWIATRSLIHIAGTTRTVLRQRSYEYLLDYAPSTATTGTPLYFCELSDTKWMVAKTPDAGVTGSARYMKRPAGLTDTNETTWLGTNAGDLLLASCMIEASTWMRSEGRLKISQGDYATKLAASKLEWRALARS